MPPVSSTTYTNLAYNPMLIPKTDPESSVYVRYSISTLNYSFLV